MTIRKKILLILIIISIPTMLSAQLIPIFGTYNKNAVKPALYSLESKHTTSVHPYYFSDVANLLVKDSIPIPFFRGFGIARRFSNNKVAYLHGLPIFDMALGTGNKNSNFIYNLNGGAMVSGGIENILGFNASIYHSYLRPPDYFISTSDSLNILHGSGFLDGKDNYYNNQNSFSLTYRPADYFLMEAGMGKNFIGDGYRSLLLSNNSYNYPYFKAQTNFLNFSYTSIWSQLKNISPISSHKFTDHQSKYAVFHYLDWRISNHVSIGFFESIVMNTGFGFNPNYLNPVIFYRPVAFYLGSEDNALIGMNLKITVNDNNILYSQFIIDDLVVNYFLNDIRNSLGVDFEGNYGWFANKWGVQVGHRAFNLLGIKGLSSTNEINIVRPYTYSHAFPEKNYSHLGQALAHPLGANFIEYISSFNYLRNSFNISADFMYAHIGTDTANTHFGQNIFLITRDAPQGGLDYYVVDSYGNEILQGNRTRQFVASILFEYIIEKASCFSFNLGVTYRNIQYENGLEQNQMYYYIGFRSAISKIERLF